MIALLEMIRKYSREAVFCLYLLVAVIAIWSLTIDHAHAHSWFERHIPLFWSLFAFLSCIVLIFFARWLARAGVEREEDYYDG